MVKTLRLSSKDEKVVWEVLLLHKEDITKGVILDIDAGTGKILKRTLRKFSTRPALK